MPVSKGYASILALSLLPLMGIASALAEAPPFLSPDFHAPDQHKDTLHFLSWSAVVPTAFEPLPILDPQKRDLATAVPQSNGFMFPEIKIAAEQLERLKRYQSALVKENEEACTDFLELSKISDFSLREMAQIRYWLLCPTQVVDVALPDASFAFYADLRNDAEMLVYERTEKWDPYLKLLAGKIQKTRNLRERTKALEMGLQVALQRQQTEHAKHFRSELERLAPRFISKPKPEEYLAVGQDWIMVREFDRGRSYLKKAANLKGSSFAQKRKALQGIRNSFKTQQNKKTHLVEAEKYFRWLAKEKDDALALEAGMYWVRALWTEGQKAKAQAEMVKLEKAYQKRTRIFEIEYIRGRMAEEESEYAKALAHYDKALEVGGKSSSLEIKIEASRAWVLRRLGKDIEAAAEFARIAATAPDQPDQLRALFWQGKSFQRAGQREKAKVFFRQVAFEDPVGYYGLVAFRELGAEIPPLTIAREKSLAGWGAPLNQLTAVPTTVVDAITEVASAPVTESVVPVTAASGALATARTAALAIATSGAPTGDIVNATAAVAGAVPAVVAKPPPRLLSNEEKTWIQELQFVGEKQVLQTYLDGLAEDRSWGWTTTDGLSLLKAYAHSGLYLPLFATIGKIDKAERETLLLAHPELLFPVDFNEMITAAAEKEEIPKELIFSIIRQESAFNPNARSFADAMGLMQILPTQAKNVARRLKMDFNSHDDLFQPHLNIPIGAHMLRQGLDKYQNNFILAIASYNANDKAIRGWLDTRFREDPVEFIEEIAYDETRGYVKLVLRNYIFYKRLQNPDMALAFPPECLPDLQNFKHSKAKEVVSR